MFKKTAVALSFCCALGVAGAANADSTFIFDTNGATAGGQVTIDAFDWLFGNVLAVGGGPTAPLAVGSVVNDLYQANLNSVTLSGANQFTNGTGGIFFTVVANFSEQVTSINVDPISGAITANFNDTTAPTSSYFYICAQTQLGSDLAGTGFGCANPIMTGVLTDILVANTTVANAAPQLLDQHGADDWSGQQSVLSGGSANLQLLITSVNSAYFPTLSPGTQIITSFTNTSLITPFHETDPSKCFTTTGTSTACNLTVGSSLGTINGANGPNFIFQADANTSLVVATVPEPATLALLGLGLMMIPVLRRGRKT
jgi:hypothetical protein